MEVKEEREDDSNPENEQSSLPMEQELTPCHCRKLHQTQNLIPCTNPNCSVLFCIQCIQKYDVKYTIFHHFHSHYHINSYHFYSLYYLFKFINDLCFILNPISFINYTCI